MKIQDIYVGERVRFREWEDMENEFGLKTSGNIACCYTFTKEMKHLCGDTFFIKGIDSVGIIKLSDEFGVDTGVNNRYLVSADMLEDAEDVGCDNLDSFREIMLS